MATAPSFIFGAGLAYGQIFKLTSVMLPAATSTSPYEGILMPAPSSLVPTKGGPEFVPVIAHNQKLGQHSFPTTDPTTLVLTLAKHDADLHAMITGTVKRTLHEEIQVITDTNQEGNEPDVAIVATADGLPTSGARYVSTIFRVCQLFPSLESKESRTAGQYVYNGDISRYTTHLTGEALTLNADGATSAAVLTRMTNKRGWYVAWLADGVEDEFLFHPDRPANDTTSMGVYVADPTTGIATERTSNLTKATTKITFTSSLPTSGQIIIAKMQLADTAIVIA